MYLFYKNYFSKSSVFIKIILCKSFLPIIHLRKPVDNVDNFVDSLFVALFRHYFVHTIYVTLLYNSHFNFLCVLYICSAQTAFLCYMLASVLVCLFVIPFSEFCKIIFLLKYTTNSNTNNPIKKYPIKAVSVIGITYLSIVLPNIT